MRSGRIRAGMAAGLLLGGACLLRSAAAAAPPAAPPRALTAQALGTTESLLRYCKRVDVKSAIRLQGQLERMVHGASKTDVERLRASTPYRTAFRAVTDFVAKVDPHNATRPCVEAVAARP